MRRLKLLLFFLLCLFLLFTLFLAREVYWKQSPPDSPPVEIVIRPGENVGDIVANLKQAGVISHAWLFKFYLQFSGQDKKIQSGYGRISGGGNMRDIVLELTNPKWNTISLLFQEGWNVDDYDQALFANGIIKVRGSFAKFVGEKGKNYCLDARSARPFDFSLEFNFLQNKSICYGLEGYLFPDTYYLQKNSSVEAVARIMLRNFDKKLTPDLRAVISQSGKDISQIIIIASLIEAEAREKQDRYIISDILWRRLKAGMGLELDSSVNYIIGGNKPAISLVEKETDSLYNTYKYRGLPPGPINNPGLSAIQAAINPVKNDYWFFLTGRDGQMRYARTLAEHNRLKYIYLK